MTRYRVDVSVSVRPLPPEGQPDYSSVSSNLYHNQGFEISGDKFGDVAPTIDGIYHAIQQVVEASHADSD